VTHIKDLKVLGRARGQDNSREQHTKVIITQFRSGYLGFRFRLSAYGVTTATQDAGKGVSREVASEARTYLDDYCFGVAIDAILK
jgi:hypothetical protein